MIHASTQSNRKIKMISRQKKFIFVHIPKTAGNSITKALQGFSDVKLDAADSPFGRESGDNFFVTDIEFGNIKHWSLENYEEVMGENIKDYLIFSCVRNPWDRIISAYFFFKQSGVEFDSRAKKLGVPSDVFNPHELKLMIDSDNMGVRHLLRPQSEFLKSNKNFPIHLIRYENLEADFNILNKKIGVPELVLPTLNKSKRLEYKAVLDTKSASSITALYDSDIKEFGYSY
jgi:hypothetical protein